MEDKTSGLSSGLRRFLLSALRLLVVVAAIVLLGWSGKAVHDYAVTAPAFAVKFVEIDGNARLTNAQLLELAGFRVGDNIFSVNLSDVEKKLEASPWILEAKVQQRLPRTIVIDVVERTARMLILFDVLYLVDSTGAIFKRWQQGDPVPSVILTGLTRRDLTMYSESVERTILDAIALEMAWEASALREVAPLSEIHAEVGGDFSLTVGDDPFYVRLGSSPYRVKLERLSRLLSRLQKSDRRPSVVYFDNEKRPDRVTVKLKD